MKKYIFGLWCLLGAVTGQAQKTAVDSTDIYKYTDLTKQQVQKLKKLDEASQQQTKAMGDSKMAYLMLMAQQQTAVEGIVKPAQRKKYQHYKMMEEATGWIKQNVSLSKEQQEKMTLSCFSVYEKMDALDANKVLNAEEKKIKSGKLMTELSDKLMAILTADQKKELEESNRESVRK